MADRISDKPTAIDWVGCIPGVGTIVGLVEMVYNFGVLTISIFSKRYDPAIVAAQKEACSLYDEATDLHDKANERISNGKTGLETHKIVAEGQKKIETGKQEIVKWQKAMDEHEEKADSVAKHCFLGMLRATWVGAIGICAYKLLKKS